MTKRRIYKIIALVVLVPVAIVVLFFAFIWGSMEWTKYSSKREAIIHQKEVCDTIKTIDAHFEFKFDSFSKKDLSEIHFYIIKNRLIDRDTVINFKPADDFETQTISIQLDDLVISDELIVYVGKRYYILSDYQYVAYYNYGMFGPVGPCLCGGTGFQMLNGNPAGSGWLIKKFGLVNYKMPNRKV